MSRRPKTTLPTRPFPCEGRNRKAVLTDRSEISGRRVHSEVIDVEFREVDDWLDDVAVSEAVALSSHRKKELRLGRDVLDLAT